MARPYELKRRAERRDQTRQRIVDAAIELHQTLGPAATTVTDIADRANVGRVTVYRHFPDEATLARACSGLYFVRHPLPDPSGWREISDPHERLRAALRETYAYHRATEQMMTRVLADARDNPVMRRYHDHWHHAAGIVAAAWRARGRRRRLLLAGIRLALDFDTWRSLIRDQGLDDQQAIEVALRLANDTPAVALGHR